MADWNALFNAPNAGAAFTNAFVHARQQRQQDEERKMQMEEHRQDRELRRQQIQAEIAMKGVEQHREAIKTGAAIIRQVAPKDQQGWNMALSALRQYGIDPDALGVPQQFQPEYAQQVVSLADALEPPKNPQLVPFTQGGGVAAFDPATNGLRILVQPNDDPSRTGQPVNAPPVLSDDDIARMEGGPSSQGSGGFPPSGY